MTTDARGPRSSTGKAAPILKLVEDLLPEADADNDERLDALADLRQLKVHVNFAARVLLQTTYDEGATFEEIGDALGISKSAAHQLYHAPLDRMMR